VLTVLEPDGERNTGRELTVKLGLSGTSTDSTPGNEISDVLGGDGVEKLGSDRNAQVGKIAQELTSEAETFVDLEGPVEVWVVDETLPSDSRTRFLFKDQ